MNNKILVITPPRCGTHLLVHSISESLGYDSTVLPSINNNMYDSKVFNGDNFVIGIHAPSSDKTFFDFAKDKKIITADRHPIAMAISMVTSYKRGHGTTWENSKSYNLKKIIKSDINSEEFINFITSDYFKEFRSIKDDWEKYGICVNFENFSDNSHSEVLKVSEFLGHEIKKTDIEETRKKYKSPHVVLLADPFLWKTIISEESIYLIKKHFPGYDMNTQCIDSQTGNNLYNNLI